MWRNRVLALTGFVCAAVLAAGGVSAAGTDAKNEKAPPKARDAVKELMIKIHRGEKSPLGRIKAEVAKDAPDWEVVARDAKSVTEMSDLLGKVHNTYAYTSPEGYITATKALGKAAAGKDKKEAAAALASLNKSCSACHYGVPK